jgi:hypothetical protein|tara:strand:- start:2365 stop:2706 length:342 start_codon:yes stop_codon:yes gene_type:complete
MPEKKNTGEVPCFSEKADSSGSNKREPEHREQTTEEWFAGLGDGMKGVSKKLLDQIPPDIREKLLEQARTNGLGSAAVAVNAAALKTRSFKVKFALKGLGKLLKVLDSKIPRK